MLRLVARKIVRRYLANDLSIHQSSNFLKVYHFRGVAIGFLISSLGPSLLFPVFHFLLIRGSLFVPMGSHGYVFWLLPIPVFVLIGQR